MGSRVAARLRRGARHGRQLIERSIVEFFEDGGPQAAASVSYFALFSLFPLAIVTVSVYGLFFEEADARERLVQFVLERVPLDRSQGSQDIGGALETVTTNAPAFGVVGLLTLVFAASGLMGAVRGAINSAWETSQPRPPLRGKLLDILLVLGLGLVVGLSFAFTLIARLAISLGREIEEALGLPGAVLPDVLATLAQLTPLLVSFAVFLFLFRVIPAIEVRTRDVWPGAVLAAVGFELVKTAFSFYLENLADYGAIYGSLATVVAFLVFVFLAANTMVIGAEAASEWADIRDGRIDVEEAEGPQQPLGERLRGFARGLVRRD